MRRYILAAVALITGSLGIMSCSLMSSSGTSRAGKASALARVATAAASPGATDDAGRVAALLRVGIQQAREQRWSAAAVTFQDVLAINPRNVYASYDLGVIDQTNNDDSGALEHYNQAIADNAEYAPALYNKAILLESSQPQAAIALYDQIVAINPQASTAYLRLALVDARLGYMTHARAAYQKAITIDPSLGKYQLPAKR